MAEPLRVMLVDDEPLAIERLQLLLGRCQDVTLVGTAPDGEAALRIAEAVRPDLVLLDIAMPGMDGLEVARALAASSLDPVVIFITAFDNFAVAAFDVAAVDYLMKPVDGERLARALDRARDAISKGKRVRAAPSAYVQEFWVPDQHGLVRIAAQGRAERCASAAVQLSGRISVRYVSDGAFVITGEVNPVPRRAA